MSQVLDSGTITPTESSAIRPMGLWVVMVLSALMAYRVVALTMMSELGKTMPVFWSAPLHGDAFIGLTALIVAGLLWRFRGLAVWTIGIVWHVIGFKDFTVGMDLHFVEPVFPPGDMVLIVFTVGMLVHLLCIYLLVRFRRYYLG